MKKLVFILLILLAGIGAEAQETLIPINEETVSIEEYDREIERLLVPANTEFGMNCIPSFDVESSLTYDSVTHALVYIEAETSIWRRLQQATSYLEKNVWKNKVMTFYHAPGTKMYLLPIRDEMAQTMRRLWNAAIGQAKFPKKEIKEWKTEDGEVLIVEIENIVLDGTGWEYFVNGKRAKIQGDDKGGKGKVGSLINLCIELREAVRKNDAQKMESLYPKVDSLYQVFEKK
ncbi:MAG: hypothetical protein IJB28_09320 [Bacteroidaceae bacterium]|nr:hypothetical protein [Bacteroidaceae bacterium]